MGCCGSTPLEPPKKDANVLLAKIIVVAKSGVLVQQFKGWPRVMLNVWDPAPPDRPRDLPKSLSDVCDGVILAVDTTTNTIGTVAQQLDRADDLLDWIRTDVTGPNASTDVPVALFVNAIPQRLTGVADETADTSRAEMGLSTVEAWGRNRQLQTFVIDRREQAQWRASFREFFSALLPRLKERTVSVDTGLQIPELERASNARPLQTLRPDHGVEERKEENEPPLPEEQRRIQEGEQEEAGGEQAVDEAPSGSDGAQDGTEASEGKDDSLNREDGGDHEERKGAEEDGDGGDGEQEENDAAEPAHDNDGEGDRNREEVSSPRQQHEDGIFRSGEEPADGGMHPDDHVNAVMAE